MRTKTKVFSLFLLFFSCLAHVVVAQHTPSVKGTIVNETGAPVAGATVMIVNKDSSFTQQTAANEQGLFVFSDLQLDNYHVYIHSVGYAPARFDNIAYDGKKMQTLTYNLFRSESKLNDVVVVGYGTEKKIDLTGAVSQVKGKVFESKPAGNVGQSLQGMVPNLNITFQDGHPGSSATFNIRGYASINNSGGSPLVLIDGIPGDINMINPSDIASVSVLKDAASSAIYGSRGAFGVVLVTTKDGQSGKLQISYNGNYGVQKQTTRTDFITQGYTMDSLVDLAFSRHNGVSYTGFNPDDYEQMRLRLTDHSLPSVVVQNRNGVDQYVYYGNTDWYHWLFQNSDPSMSHNLTVTGGSDKIKFLFSGRYMDQQGMYQSYLHTDVYHAYNFRAKIDANITKWLKLYTNTQFAANNYTWPGWGYNSNFFNFGVHALASYVPTNPDGTYTYITNINNYQIGNGIFADLQHGKTKGGTTNYNFTTTTGFEITPFNDLVIDGNYTYQLTPYSSYQRRTLIPYSIFPGTVSYAGYDQLTQTSNTDYHHTINLYGTYSKSLKEHHFKLMLGYNQEFQHNSSITGTANNLLSEDLNQLSLGTSGQQTTGTASEYALVGFFGRLNYDYNNKYLVEFNGRYDGTSRFPAGNRFGFFPSVSAGWRVSQEHFFQSLKKIVSEFKLRGSWGSLGNQDVGNSNLYPYIAVMNASLSSWINNGAELQTLSSPNPVASNLTWEKSATVDGGVDLGFLQNKLLISYDIYTRRTTDMLVPGKTLPAVFGATSPQQNAGDLKTNGFELSIQWSDKFLLANKDFNYNFGIVLSDYTAEITQFDNPNKLLSNHYVGQQLGEIWGFPIAGFFNSDEEAQNYTVNQAFVNKGIQGSPGDWHSLHAGDLKYIDLNGDGKIDEGANTLSDHGDLKRIGNSLPRFPFGITGGFNWNNIDFSFFLQGIGKENWYPGSEAGMFWGPFDRPYNSFIPSDFIGKIWSPENTHAYFPLLRGYERLNGGGELYYSNDKYLQNLAYIRLKNLTVGYSLPRKLLPKAGIDRIHVYFSGQNLFTLTKLKSRYIDPEQVANGSADGSANDYPFFKTYSFGLDLTF